MRLPLYFTLNSHFKKKLKKKKILNLGFPTFFLFFQAEQQITPWGVIGVLTTKDEGQGGDEDCDFFVICYLI